MKINTIKIIGKQWYWSILLVFPVLSLVIFWPVLSLARNLSTVPSLDAAQVIIEEPSLIPPYNPANWCDLYWFKLTNNREHSYYLTMNVNNPAISTNSGLWQPNLPTRGWYQVEAYIPAHEMIDWVCDDPQYEFHVAVDTSQARYTITHALGSSLVSGNQASYSGNWLPLGTFLFDQGTKGSVKLVDLNDETNLSRTVSFSAMRFTLVTTQTYTMDFPLLFLSATPTPKPVPQTGGVVILNRQAFDKCSIASLTDMQVWWKESPYWATNLYIGGISRTCANLELTSTWVQSVHQQGWTFIPTWVGPQAPCTNFHYRFSEDANTAYAQGRSEAEAAVATASNLGLVSTGIPGTIIYYDMEGYANSSTPACRDAVNAFTNGWVQRLHELGHKAGMYGAACSYMYDWAAISNVPDDVWIGSAYTDYYDPYANVWNVLCLDKSLWANHQRIRQYTWGHYETWGGIKLHIDSDITDGEVASPIMSLPEVQGNIAGQVNSLNSWTLADLQPVAPDEGWILVNGRLFWTSDEGGSWNEITPGNTPVREAYFLNTKEGWALAAGEGKISQDYSRIYHTSDGGDTWKSFSIGLPSENIPISMEFLDADTGWLTVKLPSSSNFSLGILYSTQDGGQTWESSSLPIGEQVHFIDQDNGWVAGGASGNELYHTQDGGATWDNVSVIPGMTDISGEVKFAPPVFTDRKNGTIIVIFSDPIEPRLGIFKSTDGGLSWKPIQTIPLDPFTASHANFFFQDRLPEKGVIVDTDNQRVEISIENGTIQIKPAAIPPGLVNLKMYSVQTGWAWSSENQCQGNKSIPRQDFTCTEDGKLWKTQDGGRSWTPIPLPKP